MASEIRVNQIQNRSGLGTITLSNTGVVISGVTTITNLSTSGNINISAGSTSAPSLSPSGDPNTGIFFPSPDTIAFAEGGVEALRIDSSGQLGIGTANPTELLHLSSTGKAKLKISADTDNLVETDVASIEMSQDGGITTGIFGLDSDNHLIIGTNSTTNTSIYIGTRNDGTSFVSASDAKIIIDNTGRVRMPYQAAIELNGNNAANIDFTSSAQVLTSTYYTQVSNRGGMSWNSSTGSITVPTTGYYFISMFVYSNTSGNDAGRLLIRANSAQKVVFQVAPTGTNSVTVLLNLAANDTVDVIADGFDLPRLYMGENHTRFNMFLLG